MTWNASLWRIIGCVAVLLLFTHTIVYAEESSSANYKLEESFFGIGGELDAASGNYQAKLAAGELAAGNSSSLNYQFQGGFNTSDVPLLEFAVNGGIYDLGILDSSSTAAVTPSFTVRNYLSSGYVVTMNGIAPSLADGGHTLTPMTTLAAAQPGTEQFGINMVDNSNPNAGTDPVQVPDSSFGFGLAATGYNSSDMFKFVSGDTIAISPKSSGQTNYAMTIIANVASSTPSGQYGGYLTMQVIPTF